MEPETGFIVRVGSQLLVGLVVLAAVSVQAGPVNARECFWDGTPPICRGQCPRGYETVKVQGCLSGRRVYCCEPLGSISGSRSPAPISRETEAETWRIRSLFPHQVQIEFYSMDRNAAWPGGGRAYRLYDSNWHAFSLRCRPGERICYGAWNVATGQTTGSRYWGVGQDKRYGCSDCCWTCGRKGNPRSITLSR
jgi:hypothetical protein